MSKSGHSAHNVAGNGPNRDFIVDDEDEVRGLVRGQILPPHLTTHHHHRRHPFRLQQEQQNRRRGALEHSLSEESETLVGSNNFNRRGEAADQEEADEEAEDEGGRLRRIETHHQQRQSNRSIRHFRHQEEQLLTGPSSLSRQQHHHNHHHHHLPFPETSTASSGSGSMNPNSMSLALSDRHPTHAQSTASLLDSMERRTQRTYRYGIGLVCVGATLNWLGFAQGHGYVDPLRYLGVACVISGSFCVCLAMCRWLGRPISVSSHRVSGLGRMDYQDGREGGRQPGDVHVINVAVPMYVPPMGEEYRPTKPPDYDAAVDGEPPPYDEAIKLSPGALFQTKSACAQDSFFNCGQPSPSHSTVAGGGEDTLSIPEGVTVVVSPCSDEGTRNGGTPVTFGTGSPFYAPSPCHPPDDVVVVVDASECANSHALTSSSSSGGNSLNAKLGAPPPYTREYTPSPRRVIPTVAAGGMGVVPTTSEESPSNLNSSSSTTSIVIANSNCSRSHDSCEENKSYTIVPVHSAGGTGGDSNSNFVMNNINNSNNNNNSNSNSSSNINISHTNNNVDSTSNSNSSYTEISISSSTAETACSNLNVIPSAGSSCLDNSNSSSCVTNGNPSSVSSAMSEA